MRDFNKLSLVLILFLLAPVYLFAQDEEGGKSKNEIRQEILERNYDPSEFDPNSVKPGRLKKLAKKAYKLGDAYTTVDYLEVYMEKKPDDHKRAFMLAEAYRLTRDYKNAEDWYSKIISLGKDKKYPKSKFYLAAMQKQNGFYEDAPSGLKDFKKSYKGSDARIFKKLVKSETAGAEQALSIIDSALKVVVTRLSNDINQETIESSPILWDDNTLVYSSLSANVEDYYSLAGPDRPEKMLYVANYKGANVWKSVGELEGPFNKEGYHVPSGALTQDKLRFYFTRCPKKETKKDKCAIYLSKFKDGQWLEPERLNEIINEPGSNSTQPTVTNIPDKKTKEQVDVLFWVSDREDKSKGGKDIWYSIFEPRINDFKRARNAGSKVNSAGDDITPFYDVQNGALYFSSNGHYNLGGFDVFRSLGVPKGAKFAPVENVGYPINTPADDVSYVISEQGDRGFIVSNRLGSNSTINPTCCDDIYQFVYTEFIKIALDGVAFEMEDIEDVANPSNMIDDLEVSLLAFSQGDTVVIQQSFPEVGQKYIFNLQQGKNYMLKAEKEYYEPRFIPISTKDITYSDTITQDIGLKKMPPKKIDIPVVYFETNRANMSKVQKEELLATVVVVMQENPELRFRIKGHSDDVGNTRYNNNLSKKRANSVYKYLVEAGIEEDRFEIVALGEDQPAVATEAVDNVEQARERNRRVEFEVADNPLFIINK